MSWANTLLSSTECSQVLSSTESINIKRSKLLSSTESINIKRPVTASENEGELEVTSNPNINSESRLRTLSKFASRLDRFVGRQKRRLISSGEEGIGENLCVFSAMQVRFPSLNEVLKDFQCSPSVFVVAYLYIHRLAFNNPTFCLTSHNIHRLAITAVLIAAKFLGDLEYSDNYFAEMGGLTLKEMNNLELKFLFMLQFRLHVTVSEFANCFSRCNVELSGGFQIEGFEEEIGFEDESLNVSSSSTLPGYEEEKGHQKDERKAERGHQKDEKEEIKKVYSYDVSC